MNKSLLISILLLASNFIYGQQTDTTNKNKFDPRPTDVIMAKFDKHKATKEGYYFGGYIVNISEKQAKKLHGKMLRITGRGEYYKRNKRRSKE